jgi:hypothetical protein
MKVIRLALWYFALQLDAGKSSGCNDKTQYYETTMIRGSVISWPLLVLFWPAHSQTSNTGEKRRCF